MDNNLNNTQSNPNTANPQNAGTSAPVNSSDEFQRTADTDQLNQKQENLTVESTGEPLPASPTTSSSGVGGWLWLAGFVVLLAVIIYVARLMVAEDEDNSATAQPLPKPAPSKASTSSSSSKKTAVNKTKSGKPVTKKHKKSNKKRR